MRWKGKRVTLSPLAIERNIRPQRRNVNGIVVDDELRRRPNLLFIQWDNGARSEIHKDYVVEESFPECPVIVIVESPFAGDMEANRQYAIRACADCFRRGEIPFASHLLYPQILAELNPEEREQGITAGYAFWPMASKMVVYADRGISGGMLRAIKRRNLMAVDGFKMLPIERRFLDRDASKEPDQYQWEGMK